jgi:alpha-D-xyloside xylohydrolase
MTDIRLTANTIPFMKKTAIVLAVAASSLSRQALPADVQQDSRGITLTTSSLITRVEVWNEGVIRVTHRLPESAPEPASLSVIAKPAGVAWKFSEEGDDFVLATPKLQTCVDKASGVVRFFDEKGAAVLSESTNGTSLTPASVGSAKKTLAVRQSFVLAPDEAIYGLGQHQQGAMNYAGTSVHLQQENREVAVPVLLSSKGYCMLWDNPAVTDVDAGKTEKGRLTWSSEAGAAVDYYFSHGPEPDRAIAGYRWLTGATPMFGKWAWGFWQCRERYQSQKELLDVVAEYRKRGVPLDGIIQDWRYWDPAPWGSHKFDPKRYPDPTAMMKTLHGEGAHLIISVWAKFDAGIPNLVELEKAGAAYDSVIPYVFPKGQGKWYDPFSPEGRRIYWRQISKNIFSHGVDGWWLDASEPELSGKWGEFRDFKTAAGPGATVFNAYPLMHTTGVYQGQRAETSAKRVFILTRSAYAGQQRNAAVTWSGDIQGNWDVFKKQIPAGLNFTASGIPYWNTDIGGFFGGDPADPKYAELFTRWFQFGAFCPMFRVHGTGKPKEIWRFDDATQEVMKKYIILRYRLLPYIYSVAWRVTRDGYTMMRALPMDFRADKNALAISDEYMFGPAFLVAPVTEPKATMRKVWLPAGTSWVNFWTGDELDGGREIETPAPLDQMPLFVRAGSIVPLGPSVQYASEKPADPIELRVYPGADGAFTLYEDEGDNYNYERGVFTTIPISWNDKAQMLTIGGRAGEYPGMLKARTFRVVWVAENHGAGIARRKRRMPR